MLKKVIFTAFAITFLIVGVASGLSNDEVELCFSSNRLDQYHENRGDDAYQDMLGKCEDYLGDLQSQYEEDIERTEQEKQNLANQIATLENRMNQLDRQIQQSEMRIRNLGLEIQDTQESINRMNARINESQDQLGEVLKTVNREDKKSTLEVLMEEENLSGFFNHITALETLSNESQSILDEIRSIRNSLETEEERLAREREEAQKTAEQQALQKAESEAARREHAHLYNMTEEEYQRQMEQKEFMEERAQEIMDRRLALVGLPDSEVPSFGEALEVARWVEGLTGIRPAFLLAIITQESALGRNVGECYLTDVETGAGRRINGGGYVSNLMATPPQSRRNDPQKFLKITDILGLDPYSTPVSCPFQIGYGGAMGPAQFIPTTWWSQREDIKSKLGREPNPWKLQDSLLASATYLSSLGGNQNERTAALRYYAGGNWNDPRHSFYGDQVVRRVECLQTFIDHETMSQQCSELVFIPE